MNWHDPVGDFLVYGAMCAACISLVVAVVLLAPF